LPGNEIAHAVTGRRPWEIYSFIPFSDQTIEPVVNALRGKEYTGEAARGLPSFVGMGVDFARAVRSYFKTGNTRKLRNWGIKYLTAFAKLPGGTQIARMVDGWIAVADEKMVDSRGKTLFRIKDPWEKTRAVVLGPWRTKAGIKYWDKRETNIFQDLGLQKTKEEKYYTRMARAVKAGRNAEYKRIRAEFVEFGFKFNRKKYLEALKQLRGLEQPKKKIGIMGAIGF
jgi:hypothetical protein